MDYQIWIDKSVENLNAAQACFDLGHFNACANRLYYAMFHAGIAALMKYSIKSPKERIGHDWLQANFSRQLIHHRKIFPGKFRPYLSDAHQIREIADYWPSSVSKKVSSSQLTKTREFVNAVRTEVSHETQP